MPRKKRKEKNTLASQQSDTCPDVSKTLRGKRKKKKSFKAGLVTVLYFMKSEEITKIGRVQYYVTEHVIYLDSRPAVGWTIPHSPE